MESRTEGLLLDGICPIMRHVNNSPNICFMLNKHAELAIAICPPIRKKGSEFREYWPMFVVQFWIIFTLNLFFSRLGPVIIALDCPQSDHHNFKNDLIVRKLASTNVKLFFKI